MEPTTLHDGQTVSKGQLAPVSPPPRSIKRVIVIAGAMLALLLAGAAIAGIFPANSSVKPKPVSYQAANYQTKPEAPVVAENVALSKQPKPVSYQPANYKAKLVAILAPLVADNVALSTALQAIDGSRSTLRAAGIATQTAQHATVAARGAVAVLTAPDSAQTFNQQAIQALTQEAGYLQAVTTTLADPSSNASGSLQSLASATNAAFVPLSSVAPGGSTSIDGVDNLLSWVAGAQSAGKRAEQPKVVATPGPTTTVTSPTSPAPAPSSSPAPSAAMRYCDQKIQADAQTKTCALPRHVAYTAPRAGKLVRRGGTAGMSVHRRAAAPPTPPGPGPLPGPWNPVIGVGDVKFNTVAELQAHHASALRVIVNPLTFQYPDRQATDDQIINDAINHGSRLELAIQWSNSYSNDQVVAFVNQALDRYGKYATWIVLGNEQELNFYGWGIENGARYSEVWKLTEPIVARRFPAAKRVAGDIYPGGVGFLEDAWKHGLPGAQIIGAHPYGWNYTHGATDPAAFVNLWHSRGELVFYDEGLAADDGWPDGTNFKRWDIPLSQMGKPDGAFVWLVGKTRSTPPGEPMPPPPTPPGPQPPAPTPPASAPGGWGGGFLRETTTRSGPTG